MSLQDTCTSCQGASLRFSSSGILRVQLVGFSFESYPVVQDLPVVIFASKPSHLHICGSVSSFLNYCEKAHGGRESRGRWRSRLHRRPESAAVVATGQLASERERERAHDAHSALVDSEECSDNSREVRNASGNIHGLDRAVYKSCRPR